MQDQNLLCVGPSPLARYLMGGGVNTDPHGLTHNQILDIHHIAYDDLVQGIQKENPGFSDHRVRVFAAQAYRPYFRRARESQKLERAGLSQ